MTARTFVFCDICNGMGERNIEMRRAPDRGDRDGRRVTDGRSWYDGTVADAVKLGGWKLTDDGRHICDHCLERGSK